MRRDLVDILGQAPAPRLAWLAGYLEAEEVQAGISDGLVVGVGLANGGDGAVAVLNPFALLQFALRDHAGFPLEVPAKPPPLLAYAAGAEDWSLDGGPPVVGATRNGRAEDPSSVEGRVLQLAEGEEVRVAFAIDRVLSGVTPAATPAGLAPPAVVALPEGAYAVGCVLTLLDAEDAAASRILHADGIAVRFARRAL
jgi:hypothetical protein